MVKLSVTAFDMFPKLHQDLKVRRATGGLMSLLTFAVMTFLLLDEVSDYFTTEWTSVIGVDTSAAGGDVFINADITFWGMRCDQFGLDVVDVTGDLQLGVEDSLQHTPIGTTGCNMFGSMRAHRVDGEFHVAFGRLALEAPNQKHKVTATMQHSTAHVHRFSMAEIGFFNASHTVHHLSFSHEPISPKASARWRTMQAGGAGRSLFALAYPDTVDHPMDGVEKIVTHDTARFTYFIKVVPTTWIYSTGSRFSSYQLSHKEHTVPIVIGPSFKQPGVFFRYELSPYKVTNVENYKPFTHFFASLCAIVGGVFVVMGIVSNAVERLLDKFAPGLVKDDSDQVPLETQMRMQQFNPAASMTAAGLPPVPLPQ
eukprot:m51a1_g13840 hypothetical protein (369) ;mRNA; f:519191-520479